MNGQLDGESLWHAFFASSRSHARSDSDAETIPALAGHAAIVIDCGRIKAAGIEHDQLAQRESRAGDR